jgi:tetratricopeptide (TPR) repeat protein
MTKWIGWAALMGWAACGVAYAEDSARVTRSVSLPSFGFGTVSQTAEVHGPLAGRYQTVPAQQDRESFVDVTEGHFQVPGGLPPSMIPDPFVPSVLEYVYEVHLPEGFELRTALPEDRAKKFGLAILTGHAARAADGSVRFSIRLDTTKAQFPPATAAEFRKELAQSFEASPALLVTFDLSAYELNMTGESTKALAAYEQRVAKRPDDAIEHIRLSDALRTLGLLDRALAEAATAVRLDPNSPPTLLSLARSREADPLGRMFQPGFDRAGALEALRTLARVDPDYLIGRYELVILLEYDTDGVRYSYDASLAEAANELLEVRKLPGYEDRWDNELLTLLAMTGQFDRITPLVAEMKRTDHTTNWLLASAFYLGGEKAARAAIRQGAGADDVVLGRCR